MNSFDLVNALSFAGTVLAINLSPGPAMLFVLQSSSRYGVGSGLVAAFGVELGVFCYVVLTALGLGVLIGDYPMGYKVVQLVGLAYLLYLAMKSWPHRGGPSSEVPTGVTQSRWQLFVKGFLVNVTNPKIGLFFVSLMPQFVSKGSSGTEFIAYGLCFNLGGILVNSSVALFANRARALIARARWFDYVPPLLFLAIAIYSAYDIFH